jgi:fumarylacetoacetate (FAA) hydrolase family protein
MAFSIGDGTVISDSTIDPGKDKDGQDGDFAIGDNVTISGSAIGHGASNDRRR